MSGSVHPKFVGEWLAEIDYVTCVDDLDRSGFAFDTDRMEFKPLDSKIVKRMVKPFLANSLRRKIDLFDERQYDEKRKVLTGRQIMYQVFSVSDINQTHGRAMHLADLVNIEMYVDNRNNLIKFGKRCCCPWIKDMKRCSNIYERLLRKPSPMENALTSYHSDILLQKKPKTYRR